MKRSAEAGKYLVVKGKGKMKNRIKITAIFIAVSMTFLSGCAQADISPSETATSSDPAQESFQESAQEPAQDSHIYEIEEKTVPLYAGSPDEKIIVNLVFMDGVKDVPYISVENFKYIFEEIMESPLNPDFAVSIEKDGENVILTRDTGYPVRLVFDRDSIEFYDLDAFFRKTDEATLIDSVEIPTFDEEGQPQFFEITDSYEKYGQAVIINVGDYGIDLIHQDDGYYLPLHLVSDIFMSQYDLGFIYNGSAIYVGSGGDFSAYDDLFYNENYPAKRSKELAEFNYNELCLALDYIYGLKSQHDITDFDIMYTQTGLKDSMLSEDPVESCQALCESINVYLDDLHSAYMKNIYVKNNRLESKHPVSAMLSDRDEERFTSARAEYYGDAVPGYEEIGNTAYITFDQFVYGSIDYYTEKAEDHLDDTMGLMIYSFKQITRDNSPIKNVVLDLSANIGGAVPSAAYVIAMFLGDGSISVKDVTSNALVTQNFKADLNLDRKFDDNDTLHGKYNLICLISPVSFSCANLVPSVLKNSHEAILMGQTSGGGSCMVQHLTTADGSLFQISGPRLMSYTKNGSFYDIDRGVEPDFTIPAARQFYDRKNLTTYINELLGIKEDKEQ